MSLGSFVSFDYLANLRKLKKNVWMGGGNEEKGLLINEKPNQGVRKKKKLGTAVIGD
jgi:hypothetical protein